MEDSLKLENQLCFPLYAASKEIIKQYKPFLDELNMTYTQYITMMVLWEHNTISMVDICSYLYLDSGTLTPVLKKLEGKGYLNRVRSKKDERAVDITITAAGLELESKAKNIPQKISKCFDITSEEASTLYKILYKIIK